MITGADYLTPTNKILNKLGWSNLKERRNKQKALMMFKIVNGMTPRYLKEIFLARPGASVYNIHTGHCWMILPYQGLEQTITGRVSRLRGLRSGMHSLII